MKKLIIACVAAASMSSAASAHDFDARFSSLDQCERAWVQSNKVDRDFLRALNPDLFQTDGDVMHFLTQYVTCAYDPLTDQWYFQDNRPRE